MISLMLNVKNDYLAHFGNTAALPCVKKQLGLLDAGQLGILDTGQATGSLFPLHAVLL